MVNIGRLVETVLFEDANYSQKIINATQKKNVGLVANMNFDYRANIVFVTFLHYFFVTSSGVCQKEISRKMSIISEHISYLTWSTSSVLVAI